MDKYFQAVLRGERVKYKEAEHSEQSIKIFSTYQFGDGLY